MLAIVYIFHIPYTVDNDNVSQHVMGRRCSFRLKKCRRKILYQNCVIVTTTNFILHNVSHKPSKAGVGFARHGYSLPIQDPKCYDRRSEKSKIKNGKKLKIKRDFPVSSNTNNVLLLQPLLLHYYYFYNTILYSLLVVSCSAPNNPMAQFHVDSMFVSI